MQRRVSRQGGRLQRARSSRQIGGSDNQRESGFQTRVGCTSLESEYDREYKPGRDGQRNQRSHDRVKENSSACPTGNVSMQPLLGGKLAR